MNTSDTKYASELRRRGTRGAVLVIESDKLIRNWLHWVLHSRGYQVLTASTTQEAETHLYHIGANHFNLVIVDVSLKPTSPQVASDGHRLYQAWKQLFPRMPFLLMSDKDIRDEVSDVYNETVDFLVKRFFIAELMEKVRDLATPKPTV
jgi:DNA-binding response OmpR family regulator